MWVGGGKKPNKRGNRGVKTLRIKGRLECKKRAHRVKVKGKDMKKK